MHLPQFLLDHWMDRYSRTAIDHDLTSSTGPAWPLSRLLGLLDANERGRLNEEPVVYSSAHGSDELRAAVAEQYGEDPEHVLIMTGASEALHVICASAAEDGGNVIVPSPAFPPLYEIPRALGLEVRQYALRPEAHFRTDPDEIARLIDARTRFILVNSPHNPSGATMTADELAALMHVCDRAGVQLISDEVYVPLSYDTPPHTAAVHRGATIVGSMSKAMCLSGLRIGWIVERDRARRDRYVNSRMYFTISNSPITERLAAAALRRREVFFAEARTVATRNRALLSEFIDRHAGEVRCVLPSGGTTAFPWLVGVDDSRPFCEALAERGVLAVPGNCFGMPKHIRIGLASTDRFAEALAIVSESLPMLRVTR